MMIEVVHDREPKWMPAEPCAFCKTPTRYWYVPHDVAVCEACAAQHEVSEVPKKRDWLNGNLRAGQTPLPEDWKCHADHRAHAEDESTRAAAPASLKSF